MNWDQISTLSHLMAAVQFKKAVIVPSSPGWSKPRPAAFMINLSGTILYKLFDLGMYIYKKKGEVK